MNASSMASASRVPVRRREKTSSRVFRTEGLTREILRQRIAYDPTTGEFSWADRTRHGDSVGHIHRGYVRISLGRLGAHYAHRLAWLYMTGELPRGFVDHADTDRTNNRWANLRLASSSQNACNSKLPRNSTTGHKGVSKYPGYYRAQIGVDGERIYLGVFATAEAAARAYAEAAKFFHGEFARAA